MNGWMYSYHHNKKIKKLTVVQEVFKLCRQTPLVPTSVGQHLYPASVNALLHSSTTSGLISVYTGVKVYGLTTPTHLAAIALWHTPLHQLLLAFH